MKNRHDFPADILKIATDLATKPKKQGALFSENYITPVAQALFDERKRAAKIARSGQGWIGGYHRTPGMALTEAIAQAIEKGTEQ